jgi:acyl carrier protein
MAEVNSLQQAQIEEITEPVKAFILETFLPGEDPSALEYDTPLISGGVIDSISTLKLVTFLEEEFDIQVQANEMNADNLDTLAEITTFVISKQ